MEVKVYGDVYVNYQSDDENDEVDERKVDERSIATIRRSSALTNAKKKVKGRDGMCICCGETSKPLEAHHIFPISKYKDLSCELDNMVSLCQSCHRKYHDEYDEANPVTFSDFMKRFAKRF